MDHTHCQRATEIPLAGQTSTLWRDHHQGLELEDQDLEETDQLHHCVQHLEETQDQEMAQLADQDSETVMAKLADQDLEAVMAKLADQDLEAVMAKLADQDLEVEMAQLADQDSEVEMAQLADQDSETVMAKLADQDLEAVMAQLADQGLEAATAQLADQDLEAITAQLADQDLEVVQVSDQAPDSQVLVEPTEEQAEDHQAAMMGEEADSLAGLKVLFHLEVHQEVPHLVLSRLSAPQLSTNQQCFKSSLVPTTTSLALVDTAASMTPLALRSANVQDYSVIPQNATNSTSVITTSGSTSTLCTSSPAPSSWATTVTSQLATGLLKVRPLNARSKTRADKM